MRIWMSHGDQVEKIPEGFRVVGSTDTCPIAAMCNEQKRLYGVQFHGETTETRQGGTYFK